MAERLVIVVAELMLEVVEGRQSRALFGLEAERPVELELARACVDRDKGCLLA